jgi:lipid-A-disaccharide synthase
MVAGEHSGDIHGAGVIEELLKLNPETRIRYMGGDCMKNEGGEMAFNYVDIAVMGFVEVLKNISKIKKYLKEVRQDIEAFNPDYILFIDFPGFNLRLAKNLHEKYSLHYYIAPKAWAWNKKRIHKLRKYFKTVNCILPFEVDFFKSFQVNAEYVGNPSQFQVDRYLNKNPKENSNYIALFPGSRKQEIERILPVMLESIKRFPQHEYRVSKAANLDFSIYEPYIESRGQLHENN